MQLNNEPLDMFYGFPDSIGRYLSQDKLLDYGSWWDFETAKSEMYPNFVDAWTWRDGKMYGVPYFTGIRGSIVMNKALLSKAGIETVQLTTWDDFYALCHQLKADGVAEYPLLNHWFGTFWATTWQFLWETHNRGIPLFDENDAYRPLFDENGDVVKMLETWRGLVADGVHPESSFGLGEGDYTDAFASGAYVFSAVQTYDARRMNDPARSQIPGQVDFATPPAGQPWGKSELGGYLLPKRDRSDQYLARVFRNNGYHGYRDANGVLAVAKRWAIEQALGSAYPEVLEDPDVIAAYGEWMPGGERQFTDMKTYFAQAQWDPFYHCPWQSEFLAIGQAEIEPAILGTQSPKDAVANLRAGADELYERFKGSF
jgi:multiple sugar transport system substrate-binding protein